MFEKESEVLEKALALCESPDGVTALSVEDFREFVRHYSKLLRKSIKVTKVGDLSQGRLLRKKNDLEMQNRLLIEEQKRLIMKEKMSSLGTLIAGIAHEVNTPIGIGITAASHLADKAQSLGRTYNSGLLTEDDLERFLNICNESARMILGNLHRASSLVRSFKEVALDQTTEKRRLFNLKRYLEDIFISFNSVLNGLHLTVKVDGSEDLLWDGYPAYVFQIATNLLNNSLMHAYEAGDVGTISFCIKGDEENLELIYKDDGCGIPKENLGKIWDPFFTTKRAKSGGGLGLYVVYNLVTQKLKGQIQCESGVGQGVCFTLRWPREIAAGSDMGDIL